MSMSPSEILRRMLDDFQNYACQLEVLGIVASKNAIGGGKVLLLVLATSREVLMHFII